MFLNFRWKFPFQKRKYFIKNLLIMKLIAIFLFAAALQVNATGFSQKITLSQKNVPLTNVFKEIVVQSGYQFFYKDKVLKHSTNVSIDVTNASVEDVLNICFKNQPLSYTISDKIIVIKEKKAAAYLVYAINDLPVEKPANIITGTVKDPNGNNLQGVSVVVKGSTKGTSTDASGSFTIDANSGDVLEFSNVGFQKRSVTVGSALTLNLVMEIEQTIGEEVVVVGYGTQQKKNITGAISTVKVGEISQDVSGNVSSALQGRVAGVSVESNGGAPGASLSVTIRGSSTLGNNAPLYVVDGVFTGSLDFVNPSDIESIEILKDASAASIYGSRAANGVMIITTKSGHKNTEPRIKLNALYGVQSVPKRMKVLNGEQWTNLFKNNVGGIPAYNGINTDWQDEIFQTAPMAKGNFNISGGSQSFIYDVSGGYLKQEGTMKKTDYSMANFRAKTQFEKGRIKIGETIIINRSNGRVLPSGGDQSGSVLGSSLLMPANVPVYDTSNLLGGWGRHPTYTKNLANPLANLVAKNFSTNNSSILVNAFAEVKLIDGLKYKLNVGLTENRYLNNNYLNSYDDGNISTVLPNLSESSGFHSSWLIENTMTYQKSAGLHNFTLLGGYTAQKDTVNGFGALGYNIPAGVYTLSGSTSNQSVNGSASSTSRVSWLGRLTYDFDSKYLFSASVRRDGSSIFSSGHQFGVFPAVSAGWNISNEEFYRNSSISGFMNNLKLRGSWGVLGNDQIGNYSTLSTVTSNINYIQGATIWQGSIPNGNASPKDLKWEQTETTDIGLEASFFNNKLHLVADVFMRTTSGVLLGVPVPLSLGITGSPVVNAGVVENKGLELSLNYIERAGALKYDIGFNLTALNNKMTQITIGSGKQEFGDLTRAKVGYPLGGFWLIGTDGIFQSQQEVDNHKGSGGAPVQPNAKPGDIKFVDFDNNGTINNDDRQYMGSPFPNLTTGLSAFLEYKKFDLNLLFQGTFGNKIFNNFRIWQEKMTEITNLSTEVLNAWTPNKPTDFPRFILADPNQNARKNSDRWLEDGSYIRFKRFELGYSVLENSNNSAKIDRLRVFLSMENVFTSTKYKGFNPDLGNGGNPLARGMDGSTPYPLQRTILVGASITF